MTSNTAREIAPGITVFTSRRMLTNSTVLADRTHALLVDPGWQPDELEHIADELDARALTVIGGFSTHAHHDHLLWHPRWAAAPRWASPRTAELARTERDGLVDALGADFPPDLVELMGRIGAVTDVLPDDSIPAGFEIELIVHDGHAPGHTALWLPRQRVLIAGDMLSDIELPLPFFPDDLASYVTALDALAPFAAQAELVIPGHGTVGTDARRRLEADRRYLDDVVRTGDSTDPRIRNDGMADMHEHLQQLVGAR
jgi:glyoxylase-like metal-dependent hydrolase (beta-lactamase superfamily II)